MHNFLMIQGVVAYMHFELVCC